MKKLNLVIGILGMVACQHVSQSSHQPFTHEQRPTQLVWQRDVSTSVLFLQDYIQQLSIEQLDPDHMTKWIRAHQLVTTSFQNAYQSLLDSAWKAAPEYGLGFDPIFDAQDFPTGEFYIIDHDSLSQTVRIGSTQWPDFSLLLQMAPVGEHYLIDKVGVVNN